MLVFSSGFFHGETIPHSCNDSPKHGGKLPGCYLAVSDATLWPPPRSQIVCPHATPGSKESRACEPGMIHKQPFSIVASSNAIQAPISDRPSFAFNVSSRNITPNPSPSPTSPNVPLSARIISSVSFGHTSPKPRWMISGASAWSRERPGCGKPAWAYRKSPTAQASRIPSISRVASNNATENPRAPFGKVGSDGNLISICPDHLSPPTSSSPRLPSGGRCVHFSNGARVASLVEKRIMRSFQHIP